MNEQKQQSECCPKFEPAPWDGKNIEWENKKLIKDRVRTFLYMPCNFRTVMKRVMGKLEKAGVNIPDYLCLSDHTSSWNMDLYVAVDKEVEGAENTTISGKFFSKVYEGPFRDTKKWCKDFEADVKAKGSEVKKMYLLYTTCPKCAKIYGKNYVVIIGGI